MEWFFAWYNVPFLISVAVGVLLMLAEVVTGGLGEMGDLDADADLDVDADMDVDADGGGTDLVGPLAWLGVGKVPLSVLVELMLVSFGCAGLFVNAASTRVPLMGEPLGFALALGTALLVAPMVAGTVGRLLAKWTPDEGSLSTGPRAYLGQVGVATSRITASVGQVRVRLAADEAAVILAACLPQGEVARGTEVVVVSHDATRNLFVVEPVELTVS